MKLAKEISTWSKDPSSQIGSIIADHDRRILATGYNGFPRGIADTNERLQNREQKYPLTVHAELNCLLNALYSGVSVRYGTLYVYGLPICSDCAKSVIQAGITRVVIGDPSYYSKIKWFHSWMDTSKLMFEEANVEITILSPEEIGDEFPV